MLKAQIEGRNNSWAVRWHGATFLKEMLTLYPKFSLVENIGCDSSGTHCGDSSGYDVELTTDHVRVERIPLKENKKMKMKIEEFFWETEHGRVVQNIPFLPTLYRIKSFLHWVRLRA
jgi:hypothetical protein